MTNEEGPAGFTVMPILTVLGSIALVGASVAAQQNGWGVQSVEARHAIFAIIAWNGGAGEYHSHRILQQSHFDSRTRIERRGSVEVVLQMLHMRHTTQHCQHIRERPGKAGDPGDRTILRSVLFQTCHQVVVQFGKTSVQ